MKSRSYFQSPVGNTYVWSCAHALAQIAAGDKTAFSRNFTIWKTKSTKCRRGKRQQKTIDTFVPPIDIFLPETYYAFFRRKKNDITWNWKIRLVRCVSFCFSSPSSSTTAENVAARPTSGRAGTSSASAPLRSLELPPLSLSLFLTHYLSLSLSLGKKRIA